MPVKHAVELSCADGVRLGGYIWEGRAVRVGSVVVNAATGVLSRYYHRYAGFLTEHGFDVLTYDYRGIGASRPQTLRGCRYRWSDWGEFDFDAALRTMRARDSDGPLHVVGHSIGGFIPGLAESAPAIDRLLAVGSQFAYWPDYARHRRLGLFLKWHVAMPAITGIWGYFPGRRLGLLEDLPAGVANEWSFRRSRMELSYPRHRRVDVLRRFAAVRAAILSVAADDDEYATPGAVRRGLEYYSNASKTAVRLGARDLPVGPRGHFGLFHAAHENGFWLDTVRWLRTGQNPWPCRLEADPRPRSEPLVGAFLDLSRG
ncbi:alpha/beta hydrolase family protein [Mesorhizobium sp. 1B3]|uniref:alpha/beta hydrolase family protein n=1 Tax=Mesorhizobium sp. 1B3 TaxID=3243599 RepID=UPI003D983AD9